MADDYLEELQKKHIAKDMKFPHPPDWKGRKGQPLTSFKGNEAHILDPELLEDRDFQKRYQVGKSGRYRKLTPKQMLQAKYMLQGHSRRQAKLKAGYSPSEAKSGSLRSQHTLTAFLEGIQGKFARAGITETYVAKKMGEWMEAKKPVRNFKSGAKIGEDPDYKTQLEAFKQWREIALPKEPYQKGKKREITLTEWIEQSEDTVPT